jgi:cytochrome o ubiquinol oxidase subunit IV
MSDQDMAVTSSHDTPRGLLTVYIIGFAVSILLTLTSFALVKIHLAHHHTFPPDNFMIIALPTLAVAQFLAQLYFFLHLGRETKPRWKLLVLALMIVIVLILVIGSIWIMYNLNYRMTPKQINQYMLNQNGGI